MSDNNKQGMSDKEFYTKLSLSLISIIGCVAMLMSTALAFFVSEAVSSGNVIKAGEFDVAVSSYCGCVKDGNNFTACASENGLHIFYIEPDGTVGGFAKIIVGNSGDRVEQYTKQLTEGVTVKVAAVSGTKIRFKPFWGNVENVEPDESAWAIDNTLIEHSYPPEPEEDETEENPTAVNAGQSTETTSSDRIATDVTEQPTVNDTQEEQTETEEITIDEPTEAVEEVEETVEEETEADSQEDIGGGETVE